MKDKFLFCLFDGLRRDIVRQDTMPNLSAFREGWVDFPNSSSVFPSETRVQVSSFVTGAFPGDAQLDLKNQAGFGHGVMANVFFDPNQSISAPLDTSNLEKMEKAEKYYGRIQKSVNLSEIMASSGKEYSVLTTGKIGNAKLLNLNANKFNQEVFSIWGASICSKAVDFEMIVERFGPIPKQDFPNNAVTEYATNLLLDYFLKSGSADLQVMWYNEPDLSFHYRGIGSPESLSSIACLDKCFGRILDWWSTDGRKNGWHLIVASDHAQISVAKQIDVFSELETAGFKVGAGLSEGNDIALKRSYSGQITVRERDALLVREVLQFLQAQPWCGLTFSKLGEDGALFMGDINVLNERSPDVYFTMRTFDGANHFGYPGLCFGDNPDIPIGGGVHGGLHSVELNNLLIFAGNKFHRQKVFDTPTGIVDILPSILWAMEIDIPSSVMGRPLKEAFVSQGNSPAWCERILSASNGQYSQNMRLGHVEGVNFPYLRGGQRTS